MNDKKTSLEVSDAEAAAVAKTPNRVTLKSIEDKIDNVEYFNPGNAPQLTIAFVKMKNGFVMTGESASADPLNFDVELGKKFARENAVRKLWQLEGYLLCDNLSHREASEAAA
jgi:hypothetical protein